jgi:hypothetical protein
MFVARHGCAIARQVYREHGLYGDDGRWCGVKLLHNATGTFHAAWVGPFWREGQEYTVRAELKQRGVDAHSRIFEARNFLEETEDWDYVFETDADDGEASETEEKEGEKADNEETGDGN